MTEIDSEPACNDLDEQPKGIALFTNDDSSTHTGDVLKQVTMTTEEKSNSSSMQENEAEAPKGSSERTATALSICDLERQLQNENLNPDERKRLRNKVKKKRQKERRRTRNDGAPQDVDTMEYPSSSSQENGDLDILEKDAIDESNNIGRTKMQDPQMEVHLSPKADPRTAGTESFKFSPASNKLQETKDAKNQELEALRNLGLAGRKSKELKKSINKNLYLQQQEQGNMEWRPVGEGLESETYLATSPSMAYEQLALEQQKARAEQREKERETIMQYQQHPESLGKDSNYKFEMDFVFGLVVAKGEKAPDKYSSTKAAAKIVPNMLASKKTIYYDPRYPPKVSAVEIDPDFDKPDQVRYKVKGKIPVLPKKGSPKSSKSGSSRRSSASSYQISPPKLENAQERKSPKNEIGASISPIADLLPHDLAASRNTVRDLEPQAKSTDDVAGDCSEEAGMGNPPSAEESAQQVINRGSSVDAERSAEGDIAHEDGGPLLEIGIEIPLSQRSGQVAKSSTVGPAHIESDNEGMLPRVEGTSGLQLQTPKPSSNFLLEEGRTAGITNETAEDAATIAQLCTLEKATFDTEGRGPEQDQSSVATDEPRLLSLQDFESSPVCTEQELDTKPSEKKVQDMRSSKDLELEALRQRGITKKKNLDFMKLEEQSARDKAASEAERQDLERRKSSTSEFKFAAGSIVNPHDLLFLQQNKQKKADWQKQHVTMLEYHGVSAETSTSKPQSQEAHLSLDANSESVRQYRYSSFFKRSSMDSSGISAERESDEIWRKPTELLDLPSSLSVEERQRRYDALFHRPQEANQDVIFPSKVRRTSRQSWMGSDGGESENQTSSSAKKFEMMRQAKNAELEAVRLRGLNARGNEESSNSKVHSSLDKASLEAEKSQFELPESAIQGDAVSLDSFDAFEQGKQEDQNWKNPEKSGDPPKSNSESSGLLGFGLLMKKSETGRRTRDTVLQADGADQEDHAISQTTSVSQYRYQFLLIASFDMLIKLA